MGEVPLYMASVLAASKVSLSVQGLLEFKDTHRP